MLQEDFIPQKWFNSIFSEFNNYELVQYPTEKNWFFSETATAKKREWLYSEKDIEWNYVWQTDWNIKWKIIVGGVMFIWDDKCHVYRFEKDANWDYVLTQVYDNPTNESVLFVKDRYNRRVKQKALCISYLNKYKKEFTADYQLSDNDENWETVIVSTQSGTFTDWTWGTENMYAYYIYFPDTTNSLVRWQIRQITNIPSWENGKKAVLSQMFYSEPIDWGTNQKCEIYEWIEDVIVFNNIRKWTVDWPVLTIWVSNWEVHFRDLGWIDIEMFEWRLWMINSYATSLWASLASWEYEILDPTTVRGSSTDSRWQKMDSLVLIKNYLLVNMENSMSVVWKMATDDNEVDPIYNINSIINWESAITPDAIFFKSWLYFVNVDRMFEGWDVVAVSSNMIYWETTNQWETIQPQLNNIWYWDYVRAYGIGRMKIIQHAKEPTHTEMLVYDDLYEWRMVREYENIWIEDKFDRFYDERVIWVWNKLCFKRWDNDLWQPISCKVSVIGSKNYINSLFSLKKIKIWLWYYSNVQKFKLSLDLWYSVFEWHIRKDSDWTKYLMWNNIAAQQWSWLWVSPLWIPTYWGWDNESWLESYIWQIWLIWVPIWKKCTYYKLTLENIENSDVNITGISVLTEGWNTYITPANNIF